MRTDGSPSGPASDTTVHGDLPSGAPQRELGAPGISRPEGRRKHRPNRTDELVEAAFPRNDAGAGELTPELLEGVQGSPRFLDVLAALTEDHAFRAGVRFRVYHYPTGGNPKLIVGAWDHDVPTEEHLGRLIAEGGLAPGRYRVVPVRGSKCAPHIEMVLDAIAPKQAAGEQGLMRELVDRLLPARPGIEQVDERVVNAIGALEKALLDQQASNQALIGRVEQLEQALVDAGEQGSEEVDDDGENPLIDMASAVLVKTARKLKREPIDVEAEDVTPRRNGMATSGPLREAV